MSSSSDDSYHGGGASQKKYKGVRRRKWGKWVSEIRVPGTPERLWLGSYATAEAAAVAHDVAFYCLRGDSSPQNLNFHPVVLPAGAGAGMSPRSVQKAASDAGLATDARLIDSRRSENIGGGMQDQSSWQQMESSPKSDGFFNISVEDYL
ncbi:ethylene-responsive transcription factor ERF020 [Salvia miltiorrhiza]|uniref:ethylene-responsive transcription factor ERF020 n=1 Tax=Salvia miltiorrhiza TaxID=226208 RepID=UPI0025AD0A2A|nr:ethylene-responsive transcription factor ERF020 [Salvia miltiorrhiza]